MKEIKGFKGYMITEDGKIWSNKSNRFLKSFDRNISGYPSVNFYVPGVGMNLKMIHQLVLENFVGPRPVGFVAAHLDGNPRNNILSNLAWVSQKENMEHKVIHGTSNRGEKNANSILTKDQAQFILNNSDRYSNNYLARLFGVSSYPVAAIIKRKTWRHLTKNKAGTPRLSKDDVAYIKKNFVLANARKSNADALARQFSVTKESIFKAVKRDL